MERHGSQLDSNNLLTLALLVCLLVRLLDPFRLANVNKPTRKHILGL